MKSLKNQRNSLFSFAGIAVFAFFILLFSGLSAKPFILKSVDGSWLPMIAQSWVAKNGGVLVKIADGIKPNELRKEMLSKIPDLSIEILGKDLFFPTTTPDSLFELLKNIDLDVAETGMRRQSAAETSEMFVKKSAENPASKDEYTEALVENVVFDEKNENMDLERRILFKVFVDDLVNEIVRHFFHVRLPFIPFYREYMYDRFVRARQWFLNRARDKP